MDKDPCGLEPEVTVVRVSEAKSVVHARVGRTDVDATQSVTEVGGPLRGAAATLTLAAAAAPRR